MYRVLYRKYRPQTFSQVFGQQHVTSTLTHELEAGRLSHAYLFTGTRGTGKTTCSLLLARAVNCENPVQGNPCNECEICRGIADGTIMDVIEIDAASNNGVDNIRDLREEANFTPVRTKYRVYIIDEVHMLTVQAFNALLKIMEEPPSHVIFILATTEVHKIPATILSRCQRFDFRRLLPEDIAQHLDMVAQKEGFSLTREAALLIARIADGASRDALNLLDRCFSQVSASEQNTVDANLVTRAAGIADRDAVFTLAQHIADENPAQALLYLHTLYAQSCDMEQLCNALVFHLRDLLVVKTVAQAKNILICTTEDFARLCEQEALFSITQLLRLLRRMEEALSAVKRDLNKRILLELTLIELCSPALDSSAQGLLSRIETLESQLAALQKTESTPSALQKTTVPSFSDNIQKEFPPDKTQTIAQQDTTADIPLSDTQLYTQKLPQQNTSSDEAEHPTVSAPPDSTSWARILTILQASSPPLYSLLQTAIVSLSHDVLEIQQCNPALQSFLEIPAYKQQFTKALEKELGHTIPIQFAKTQMQHNPSDPLFGLKQKIEKLQ